MALTGPRYSSPRFFDHASTSFVAPEKGVAGAALVSCGSKADSQFRAIAIGLLDHFTQHPRAQGDWLNKFLSAHFSYFPEHRTKLPGLITPAERMQQLITHVRSSELVQTMSYTLRQMAVTELCAYPVRYRETFAEPNDLISPQDMREPTCRLHDGVAALAHLLDVPVLVQRVEMGKTLPRTDRYFGSSADSVSPIVLQVQNGQYSVRVTSRERFAQTGPLSQRLIHPVKSALPNDPTRDDIHAEIAAEDERLLQIYDENYHRLSSMLSAGELSKASLLAIYVSGLSYPLSHSTPISGLEHGYQAFFDAIFMKQPHRTTRGEDPLVVNALIHAIAGAIAIGQMSTDKVFSKIDETEDFGVSSKGTVSLT